MRKYVKPEFDVEKINIDDIILVSTSDKNHEVDGQGNEQLVVGGVYKPGDYRI